MKKEKSNKEETSVAELLQLKLDAINNKRNELEQLRKEYYNVLTDKFSIKTKYYRFKNYIDGDYTYMFVNNMYYDLDNDRIYIEGLGYSASFSEYMDDTSYYMSPGITVFYPAESIEEFFSDSEFAKEITEDEFVSTFMDLTVTKLVDSFGYWHKIYKDKDERF